MDIFHEQIIKKKKTTAEKLTVGMIWLGGWVLCMLLVWLGLSVVPGFLLLLFLGAVGVVWGAIKLAARLNLEYEYCVTNGTLDIDTIVNRNSRKRMISAEVEDFDSFEPFDPQKTDPKRYDRTVIAVGDVNGPLPLYAATLRHPVKGRMLIVFQPDERVLGAVNACLNRTVKLQNRGK